MDKPNDPNALTVEASVSDNSTVSLDMGNPLAPREEGKLKATTSADKGIVKDLTFPDAEDEGEDDASVTELEEDVDGTDGEPQEDAEGDLGAYDPEKPEAFDAAYFTPEGQLNMERLSAEFFANAEKGTQGLNAATYDYLQDRLGLTKEQIKAVEAGQVALNEQRDSKLFERAGGKERLQAAVAWGKEGGYNEAQRQRFNTVMKSNDPEAIADAIDALMVRFDAASGKPRPKGPPRRPSAPARSATEGTPAAAQGGGFANYEAYQAAFREANAKKDQKAIAEVRKKLSLSPWFRKKG